jgi:hypothetical protein
MLQNADISSSALACLLACLLACSLDFGASQFAKVSVTFLVVERLLLQTTCALISMSISMIDDAGERRLAAQEERTYQ